MRTVYLGLGVIGMLAAAAPAYAQATAAPGFSFSASTGIDYSTGDYGAAEDTEILVIPFALRATTGNLALTASVPYLRIDGPGNVVVGPGGEPLPGIPTTGGEREGIGDLTLGAMYTIPAAQLGGFELGLGGRVKLPTSAESDQLSTGETDFTALTELSYPLGNVVPFVNVGYRFLGDPEGVDLQNGFTASVGTTANVGRSVLIASYDYAEAVSPLAEDSHEIFAGLAAPLGSILTLTGYGVAGLSQGSPDFGVGLLVTAKLF